MYSNNIMSKLCFITAIFGNYELTCKPFVSQTTSTDFICFTDNTNIVNNGWIIWPYTLPNNEISGLPHHKTDFYIKHEHHK